MEISEPLADILRDFQHQKTLRGDMPGHKGRPTAEGRELLGSKIWQADVTEIPALVDGSALLKAQQMMAQLCRAKQAHFLLNGATQGILAAIMALCPQPGCQIIVPRNAHKSVWQALALTQAQPIWLPVFRDAELGTVLGIAPQALQQAIAENPAAVAAVFVHPSYEGLTNDLRSLVKIAAEAGLYALVDEAHGAHFSQIGWPEAATDCGAALIVQGWHKTMGSLTQTAVLLQNAPELPIQRTLEMLTTSSPSYILAASLDLARANWQQNSDDLAANMLTCAMTIRRMVADCSCLYTLGVADFPWPVADSDPTKILLASRQGHAGRQIAAALAAAGLNCEMCAEKTALLLLGAGDNAQSAERIGRAVRRADKLLRQQTADACPIAAYPEVEAAMSPGQAYRSPAEWVELTAAAGRIAAANLTPYPPGIPLCGLGEIITGEVIDWIQKYLDEQGVVQGVCAGRLLVCR